MTTFVSLILCIASTVPISTAHKFAEAARARGYLVSRLSKYETSVAEHRRMVPNRCALVVVPGWADMTSVYFADFDKRRPMSFERATDILKSWEARL